MAPAGVARAQGWFDSYLGVASCLRGGGRGGRDQRGDEDEFR